MSERIDSYKPRGNPAAWARVRDEVRATVRAAEPLDRYTAGELMGALTKVALFADGQGLPADRKAWLSRELIERFTLVGIAASDRTKANYRSKLLLLREAVIGSDCRTGKPIKLSASTQSKPYTPAEISALWSWAAGQPTEELRAGCKILLSLGLGCGLDSPEVIPVLAHDIRRSSARTRHGVQDGAVVVAVRGARQRLVVCRRSWERVLEHEAARFDGQAAYLFRPGVRARTKNTVTNFVARAHSAPRTPQLKMARLRATWLVELIETNVPLHIIVAAAGLDTLHGLSRVLPHVRPIAAGEASTILRGEP
ncbi:hypothetical protein ABZ914_27935 [Spirillospora sp. NPDC046719]